MIFFSFSVDLKPIVPAILYKDILQPKKSVETTDVPKSPEETLKVSVENSDEVGDVSEDEDLDEPINEDEEVAPPDIEGEKPDRFVLSVAHISHVFNAQSNVKSISKYINLVIACTSVSILEYLNA